MKIAIPVVNTKEHKYDIAPGFNATPYICIYDSGQGEYSWLHTNDVLGNEDNIMSYFEKTGLSAIITSVMKPMALSLFNKLGIKVYKSDSTDLIGNIQSFEQDELYRYTAYDALANVSVCGDSCDMCTTKNDCRA